MENVKLPSDKKMFMMLNKKNKKRVKQACCLCWSGPVVRKRTEVHMFNKHLKLDHGKVRISENLGSKLD